MDSGTCSFGAGEGRDLKAREEGLRPRGPEHARPRLLSRAGPC